MSNTQKELHRFSHMMQNYLTTRLKFVYRQNRQRVMMMKSRNDALAYCADVQQKLHQVFGCLPKRTPLNLRVTREIERKQYTIRNIIFDSRPNFPVTANLLLPKGYSGLRPAVLCLCGHSLNGKAHKRNQAFAQALAKMGYITLIFDPLGQGERLQYHDGKGRSLLDKDSKHMSSVLEHNLIGRQQVLVGEHTATWFLWDAIRALDVLLALEGVDKHRVGVTGNSGGGTQTAYLAAIDERITMAAPSCYISSWYHNGSNELPIDAEQVPFGILGKGLEQSDLLLAFAPNPVAIITQEQDFFDQRGSAASFDALHHVYELLGAEDKVTYHVGPHTHGYWQDGREAMYSFFHKHSGLTQSEDEPDLDIEQEQTLQCTETGQVDDMGAHSVFDLTRNIAKTLAEQRGTPKADELKKRVEKVLNLPKRTGPPEYHMMNSRFNLNYARAYASHYVLETDPNGIQVVVTKLEDTKRKSRPSKGHGTAVLYLPHHSSDKELREDKFVYSLELEYENFFACDYRGIGESIPDTYAQDMFIHPYGSDYFFASNALLFSESYVGWRVHDILCTVDWMASLGYDQIKLVAKGWGTIPGAFAALLAESVKQVTLINAPTSYQEMAETKMQQWPLSAMLPNVLAYFDLPDIYRELKIKHLELIDPLNALMKEVQLNN